MADLRTFRIVGGKGNPRALRQHIAKLRAVFSASDDTTLRDNLLKRIGKLMGGSATLWVGGATELEIETRKELAERTAASVRAAMMEGVVPGGGVALLACRPVLQQMAAQSDDSDERAAYRILLKALAEPFRTIVANAGYDASDVMAEVRLAGPGHGYDVTTGQVVDVMQTGIYDPAVVLKSAVYAALTTASLALTVDVLIHRTEQPEHASVHIPSKRKQL
jgi:chaperonin GroEL